MVSSVPNDAFRMRRSSNQIMHSVTSGSTHLLDSSIMDAPPAGMVSSSNSVTLKKASNVQSRRPDWSTVPRGFLLPKIWQGVMNFDRHPKDQDPGVVMIACFVAHCP